MKAQIEAGDREIDSDESAELTELSSALSCIIVEEQNCY